MVLHHQEEKSLSCLTTYQVPVSPETFELLILFLVALGF